MTVDVRVLIAQARERAEKATPGPWVFSDSSDPRGRKGEFRSASPHNGFMLVGPWINDADAEFIAAARTDVPALCDALEAAHAEVERLRELADFARLLGPARMVLDRCAEGVANPSEAADMAQRIVDLIGHPVTDEPPHALVELDRLRTVADSLATALREIRTSGVEFDDPRLGWVSMQVGRQDLADADAALAVYDERVGKGTP